MYSVHVLLIVGFLCSLRHFHSFIMKTLFNHKSDTNLLFFLFKSVRHIVNETKMLHKYQANDLFIFEYFFFQT